MKKSKLTKEQQFGIFKKTGHLVTEKKSSPYGVIEYTHEDGRKEVLTELLHFGYLNKLKASFIKRGYEEKNLKLRYPESCQK